MRDCKDSLVFNGFLETPLFFIWLQTNSSGFRSGAYGGRKWSSNRPFKDWMYRFTALALCAGCPSTTKNTFCVWVAMKFCKNGTNDSAFNRSEERRVRK